MPEYIYAAEQEKRRDFESWREVPTEFKTKRQWLKAGRRVLAKAKPQARVVYPRIIEWPCSDDRFLAQVTDELTLITDPPTALFHLDQTKEYRASARTRAYFAFEEIFFDHARKDSYALKFDRRKGQEQDGWYTVTGYADIPNPADRGFLSSAIIRRHINQREIVGIKATDKTLYRVIDLDFHERDAKIFEDQADVLLSEFHGKDTWHFQVKRHDVTGLHLIQVFEEARDLDEAVNELRQILIRLDAANPELAHRARNAGMATLAELEIYPNRNHAVRLPLCFDREMLLDKPLPLVTVGKKQVQDVEGYIRWLNDTDRKYMPKEQILDYLHYFAIAECTPKASSPKKEKVDWANGEISANGWNKKLKSRLPGFWLEGDADGVPLNEHIVVLCRLAAVYGYCQQEIERSINAFVKELPAAARKCSSRLVNGKMRKIASVVKSSVKFACDENGHQDDSAISLNKLEAVLARWNGFDPLNKSTWSKSNTVAKVTVTPKWSKQDKQDIVAYLSRPLFVKDDSLIIRFVNEIVNLTLRKDKEGNGWGKEFLLKWMNSRFPEIKCAKDEKRQRIIVALQELGIIRVRVKGKLQLSATHWVFGERAITATQHQSGIPATKEHLYVMVPFFQSNDQKDEKPPESFLRRSIKSGDTDDQLASVDLMESILERIEPALDCLC